MKQFILAACIAFIATFAHAADAPMTITFRNGSQFIATTDGITLGTSLAKEYIITRASDHAPTRIESIKGGTSEPRIDGSGTLGCFDLFYDKKTDLLQCNTRGTAGQSWNVDHYSASKSGIILERSEELFAGEEEKTVIHYQRKH